MAQKIRAIFIFEILGRPPEHIKEALDNFVSKMGLQKGIEIVSKTIHEPKPIEDKEAKDLFTTFAEVEVLLDSIHLLFAIVLNMLPSSVEIIQPEEIRLSNFELNSVLSELAVKLHKYDEIAKTITIENNNLIGQLNAITQAVQSKNNKNNQNITFTTGDNSKSDDKKPAKGKVNSKKSSIKKKR
ncbi:Uncharacterised protein [uncultured archaeon]|nr:Uncharacterised protein [uncultured archaeon]